MIGLLGTLAACLRAEPSIPPDPLLLSGSVTLSVDVTANRARLRVRTIVPSPGQPPAERHGLALDQCASLEPLPPLQGEVLRGAQVRAWCAEQELTLDNDLSGVATHLFSRPPPPGTSCVVEVDGQTLDLPPLPEAPVVDIIRGRLRWEPGDADELRFVVPRSDGVSTICRLVDDGDAPAPADTRHQLSFASRVRLALPELESGVRLPVSVIAGTWRSPTD